ncbi:MAG: signal peptidase II [Bryobacterales bacterium]|nr:signal peptidase II [Bryobacteraceae bacterium]MDW8130747.1 signal peptidase II [Bryobacterales bacterium]
MHFRLAALVVAGAVFAADRISKAIIESRVTTWETIVVIPGLFNIVHTRNPGAAFSLLATADEGWRSVLLIGLSLIAVTLLALLLWRPPQPADAPRWALALMLGGALGNLYDRVVAGEVTDFLEFYLGSYRWPAFNLADSAISLGAAWIVLDLWRSRRARRDP